MNPYRIKKTLALLLSLAMALGMVQAASAVTEIQEEAAHVVAELMTGSFDAVHKRMTADTQLGISRQDIEDGWNLMIAKLGEPIEVLDLKETWQDPYDIVQAYVQHSYGELEIIIVFNNVRRLHALNLIPKTYYTTETPLEMPDGASEESITLRAGEADETSGLLALPAGDGPFPAAIFIHDMGASDMDASFLGVKPFRDMAVGLASGGVASLRYDKYTFAHADLVDDATLTIDQEYGQDVHAAIELLQADERIGDIYLLGHGTGGTLVPRLLQEAEGTASGGILLGASPRPLWELLAMYEKENFSAGNVAALVEGAGRINEEVARAEALRDMPEDELSGEIVFGYTGAYHIDLITPDPVETAKSLALPLLVLQGAYDYEVSPVDDFSIWQEALSGLPFATLKLYTTLSHLFLPLPGELTNSIADYAGGHVSADVTNDIAAWIIAQGEATADDRP